MTQLALLADDRRVDPPEPVYPRWYRPTKRPSQRSRRAVAGVHPIAGPVRQLGPMGSRCRFCLSALPRRWDGKGVVCGVGGPATIAGWRGCDRYRGDIDNQLFARDLVTVVAEAVYPHVTLEAYRTPRKIGRDAELFIVALDAVEEKGLRPLAWLIWARALLRYLEMA